MSQLPLLLRLLTSSTTVCEKHFACLQRGGKWVRMSGVVQQLALMVAEAVMRWCLGDGVTLDILSPPSPFLEDTSDTEDAGYNLVVDVLTNPRWRDEIVDWEPRVRRIIGASRDSFGPTAKRTANGFGAGGASTKSRNTSRARSISGTRLRPHSIYVFVVSCHRRERSTPDDLYAGDPRIGLASMVGARARLSQHSKRAVTCAS
jgi:hypothetical protein